MSGTIEFLRECGVFYVLTINGDFPAGRPFGAAMELDGELYISTEDMKPVYSQLKARPQMQIIAHKPGTRRWLRITGLAEESNDINIKERMLQECPVLKTRFPDMDAESYAVFRIDCMQTEMF